MGGSSSSRSTVSQSCKYMSTECHIPEGCSLKLPMRKASVINHHHSRSNDDYIDQWNDKTTEIMWDIRFQNSGSLTILLALATDKEHAGAKIEVELDKSKVSIISRSTGGYNKVKVMRVGATAVKKPGLFTIRVRATEIREVNVLVQT